MTEQEHRLADEKMRAEISKLLAETPNFNRQTTLYGVQIFTSGLIAGATLLGAAVALVSLVLR